MLSMLNIQDPIHVRGVWVESTVGRINPLSCDPCMSSPCRCRPDPEYIIPSACLIHREGFPKNNRVCESCGWIPGSHGKRWTDAEIRAEIENGLFAPKESTKAEEGREFPHPCDFPGCEQIVMQYGDYCHRHGLLIRGRYRSWTDSRGGEPPFEYLHRPEPTYTKCAFPGCDIVGRGEYCNRHGNVVARRRNSWIKRTGTEPSTEYLHKPVRAIKCG